MRCTACGADNRVDAGYCAQCGGSLSPTSCPACAAPASARARFCDSCGEPLAASPTEDAEHRPVTVLFADAEGSTALIQRIGDEEAYRLMQRAVGLMVESVRRHHGTVTQFRGDGVMALFGAPVAREDSAVAAVLAGLDLQQELERLSDDLVQRLGMSCRFRVGVHTGPVVVGRLADRVVVDITAIGDTANVASRLEQAAEPGAVWLSEATWRVVRDFVDCTLVGPLTAKGVSEPVVAYRAERRTAVRTRFEAAAARGLSRFVGRDSELALLESMVGRRQAVLLVGEAGIGKSRLLLELRARVGERARWIEGQCRATGSGTPWLPIVDLLQRAFDIDDTTPRHQVAEVVDDPYLQWLLRAADEDAIDPEPQARRAAIQEALRSFATGLGGPGPAVLVVEDLHWADDASLGAIAALADAPVLLIATTRPGHDVVPEAWTTKLALDPLAADDAAALAAGALGADDLPVEVRDLVAGRTEGNPLFVEEMIAALAETGALRRDGDGWVLAADPDSVTVPATLHEVILARIDRLDPEARAALQLAAVIGREFTRTLLERIARLQRPLDGHLGELLRLELIRQKAYFPELTFLFKHALTHEVTYSTLLADRRRELHRIVALAIEELYGERVEEVADELARHWVEAGDERRALDYLDAAADRALSVSSVREALAYFRLAVDLCRHAEDHRLPSFAAALGQTYLAAGDMGNAVQAFEDGVAAARARGDREGEVVNLGWRAYCEVFTYRFDEATATLDEAMAIEGAVSADARLFAVGVRRVLADVTGRLDELPALEAAAAPLLPDAGPRAWSLWHGMVELRANWRACWHEVGKALARLETLPGLVERSGTLWTSGMVAAGRGDYRAALELLHHQLDIAERLGEVAFRARALNTLGWVHCDLRDLDGGLTWNQRCLDLLHESGLPDVEIESNVRLNVADVHLAAGRLDDAERELAVVERVVRRPSSPGDQWMRWRYSQHWFHTAGEVALARGTLADAGSLADECIAAARQTESPKNEVKGLRLRGQCRLASGDAARAVADLAAAVALAESVGNPPQLWRSLTALAQARDACGDRAAAAMAAKAAVEAVDTVVGSLRGSALAEHLDSSADAAAARVLL